MERNIQDDEDTVSMPRTSDHAAVLQNYVTLLLRCRDPFKLATYVRAFACALAADGLVTPPEERLANIEAAERAAKQIEVARPRAARRITRAWLGVKPS